MKYYTLEHNNPQTVNLDYDMTAIEASSLQKAKELTEENQVFCNTTLKLFDASKTMIALNDTSTNNGWIATDELSTEYLEY